ncbi:MAG: META domain-containing protein [Nocardioides sp.]|nr:META domain-containing protein [Nocardioides sp.]
MPPGPFRRTLCVSLLLVLAGCGTTGSSGTGQPSGDARIPVGSWVLTAGEDSAGALPLLESHPVTLEVGEEAVSGTAACNGYRGSLAGGADGPLVGSAAVTEMGCMPPAVMTLERRYLDALARTEAAEVRDPGLVLTGPSVRLEFRAAGTEPQAPLTGGAWVVESVVTGGGPDAAVSSGSGETRFRFRAGGRLEVRACSPWAGRWTSEGGSGGAAGTLTVSRAGVYDSIPCTSDRREETRAVARVGARGGGWRIQDGRLTVTAADGSALVLVRSEG